MKSVQHTGDCCNFNCFVMQLTKPELKRRITATKANLTRAVNIGDDTAAYFLDCELEVLEARLG